MDGHDNPEGYTFRLMRWSVVLWGTLAVWAAGRLGRAAVGPRVGVAAAWIAAANPLAIAFSVMLLSESLFAFLVTVSLWGVALCVRRPLSDGDPASPRWGPATWAGLAAAGATLTRPVWLPFAPLVAAWAVCRAWRSGDGRRAAWVLPFGLAFLIGYAPWPIRNTLAFGEPVLTTTWAGPTLYDSLGPQATGASDMRFRDRVEGFPTELLNFQIGPREWSAIDLRLVPPEQRRELIDSYRELEASVTSRTTPPGEYYAAVERAFGPDAVRRLRAARVNEAGSDRLYRRAAWRAAAADPLRVARLAVVKQGRFWRPWPVGGMPGGAAGFVLKAGFAAFFLPLAGLAIWGGVRLWRERGGEVERVWALALTWGPVLGTAAVCLVFVGSVRYRLPGEFPLGVAAAVGGLDLWRRSRGGSDVAGTGG